MGLRDRLLNRIKRTIGTKADPIVPKPPAPPPGVTLTTRPAPTPAPPEPAPIKQTTPTPEPAPEPEPVVQAAPAPAPAQEPDAAPAPESRADGLVAGALPVLVKSVEGEEDGWVSDYATDDAPVRNAHYQTVFESTDAARRVRVLCEEEDMDIVFLCEPNEFILDAADRAGFELPFSCRSGGCLSCSALLLSGTVEMGEQYVLEEEHTDAGYFLLCCAVASTDLVLRSHQEDSIS